jgi:hypothetical protein
MQLKICQSLNVYLIPLILISNKYKWNWQQLKHDLPISPLTITRLVYGSRIKLIDYERSGKAAE